MQPAALGFAVYSVIIILLLMFFSMFYKPSSIHACERSC